VVTHCQHLLSVLVEEAGIEPASGRVRPKRLPRRLHLSPPNGLGQLLGVKLEVMKHFSVALYLHLSVPIRKDGALAVGSWSHLHISPSEAWGGESCHLRRRNAGGEALLYWLVGHVTRG